MQSGSDSSDEQYAERDQTLKEINHGNYLTPVTMTSGAEGGDEDHDTCQRDPAAQASLFSFHFNSRILRSGERNRHLTLQLNSGHPLLFVYSVLEDHQGASIMTPHGCVTTCPTSQNLGFNYT